MDCTIRVAKTKALISFAVTAKLICRFVFAYAKIRFSHYEAHIVPPIESKQETRNTFSVEIRALSPIGRIKILIDVRRIWTCADNGNSRGF